jgi:hypothetical protein
MWKHEIKFQCIVVVLFFYMTFLFHLSILRKDALNAIEVKLIQSQRSTASNLQHETMTDFARINSPTPVNCMSGVCPQKHIINFDFSHHQMPIVIASCKGRPGFRMSLPNYNHLHHWINQAIKQEDIDIGEDYIRYQNMFINKKFSQSSIMIDVGCNHGLSGIVNRVCCNMFYVKIDNMHVRAFVMCCSASCCCPGTHCYLF